MTNEVLGALLIGLLGAVTVFTAADTFHFSLFTTAALYGLVAFVALMILDSDD